MAHLEASNSRAGNIQGDHLAAGIAIAQIGPITVQTQTGSPVVRFTGIGLPGAYAALQAQFGYTPSPLEVPQADDVEERKARFRQEQLVRRQLTESSEPMVRSARILHINGLPMTPVATVKGFYIYTETQVWHHSDALKECAQLVQAIDHDTWTSPLSSPFQEI